MTIGVLQVVLQLSFLPPSFLLFHRYPWNKTLNPSRPLTPRLPPFNIAPEIYRGVPAASKGEGDSSRSFYLTSSQGALPTQATYTKLRVIDLSLDPCPSGVTLRDYMLFPSARQTHMTSFGDETYKLSAINALDSI